MKEVLYHGAYVPPEWIAAHGMTPVRLRLHATECESNRAGVCPYAAALLRGVQGIQDELVVLGQSCDQVRRVSELIGQEAKGDPAAPSPSGNLFMLYVPAVQSSATRDLYRAELARLSAFLIARGGAAPVMHASPAAPAWTTRRHTASTQSVRIAVMGGHLLTEHEALYRAIESLGGAIVLDGMEGGERTVPLLGQSKDHCDPLEKLTAAYFDRIPDISRHPNDALCEWLVERVRNARVQGIVFCSYTGCDLWRAGQRRLAGCAGVPSLFVELGCERHLTGRTLMRIEAFLESLA